MVCRTGFASAGRRHSPREPFPPQLRWLADLTSNHAGSRSLGAQRRPASAGFRIPETSCVPIECRSRCIRTHSVYSPEGISEVPRHERGAGT
jgi:hypothetical protein